MTADNHDPFALARSESDDDAELFALIAEYWRWEEAINKAASNDDDDEVSRLCDQSLVDYDPAQADAISRRCVEIEDRMAELVPTSTAGAAAQLWLLRHWARDFEWNEPLEQLSEKLLVGLANIRAVACRMGGGAA